MTGALLTELTTKLKTLVAVAVPSSTVKVTVDVPLFPATGARETVQLGAVPPKEIPPVMSTDALDEDPLIEDEQFKVLSTSVIVKATPVSVTLSEVV